MNVFFDFNNPFYNWAIVVLLYVGSAAHIAWHWPVWRRQMSWADKRLRTGLLLLMLTVASSNVGTLNGWDTSWRRPAFLIAGVLITTGFVELLWRFRWRRQTAPLQPQIGNPPRKAPR